MEMIFACFLSFAVTGITGGKVILPALRRLKAGQEIREVGPKWHATKAGTPTMGGLMFITGITASIFAAGWSGMMAGDWSHIYVLLFALVFGVIGFLDDYEKVKHHQNLGLTALQKFLLQLAAAIAFLALLRHGHHLTPNLYIPFVNATLPLSWGVYLVFAAFVMVGCVNAVNLTDGVDGLAGSVTLAVSVFFAVLSHWWDCGAVGVFAGALAGGLLGFLVYNFHPAKVFMGDTGSLFLGGAVCAMAFALDAPLVLVPVGVIYIAETMSDIIQVGYFKLTHGKRIFRMAPLHHHLELGGWSEVRIVLTFAGITVAFCLLAFVGVMYRYAI